MCQAYESEAAWVVHAEDRETCKGYAAHRDGLGLDANPNVNLNSSYFRAWKHGWECREEGIVPWAIDKLYRKKRSEETGIVSYDYASIEVADALV